ncbi:MAG: thiolase family protein [Actinobacteria bacterium]|nr:thiolase family protein [Actinomycetota bacterium]MBV9254033.1 thiolase family protein [Actinomycetota bacterium]MBV9665272.1 thiolase family protein [Actinomycetota bacterium]MBV9934151.1 thiolase family protein [Actinomycetota bacterium]
MNVAVAGVGIHPFGRHDGVSASAMGAYAVRQALRDAGITWDQVQYAAGGSIGVMLLGHEGAATADTLVNELGLTGLTFVNVANGCATAGTAVATAASAIESGMCDVAVAVGFDKHPRGHFNADAGLAGIGSWYGELGFMVTTQFFAMKLQRYMHDYGITRGTLAKVAAKAYRNGALNPNAWRRKPLSEQEILESRMLNDPLTQYMFCSPDEGAAAVVLVRGDNAGNYPAPPVYLKAATVQTRRFGAFEVFSPWLPAERGETPVVDAVRKAYEQAGVGPADIDVAQLQDSEAGAEIMHMAESGLCADGDQEHMIQAGETEIGGRLPINTDGGLIANGEPIGASGMRQIVETVFQLRGDAGERQVPGSPSVGLTQVYGAPGIGACTILTT